MAAKKKKKIKKKIKKPVKKTIKGVHKKTPAQTKKKTSQKKKIAAPKKLSAKIRMSTKKLVVKKLTGKESEKEKKSALRKLLINKREALIKEAKTEISKYIKGETKQLVDTALDDGDWSVVDLSEDVSLKQLGTHRETLLKIDEALRKLDEGTYGICEDCGEEISEQRLKVLPFAIYCRDCQEKIEQLEEIEREEPLS